MPGPNEEHHPPLVCDEGDTYRRGARALRTRVLRITAASIVLAWQCLYFLPERKDGALRATLPRRGVLGVERSRGAARFAGERGVSASDDLRLAAARARSAMASSSRGERIDVVGLQWAAGRPAASPVLFSAAYPGCA